jgi:DNA-binding MarR family transcriptional regulator
VSPQIALESATDVEFAAWRGFLRVHASVVRQLDADLEAQHQLPLTSYEVLATLAEQPGGKLRMCDLADAVALSRSGLTRLVDRLSREGWIERKECTSDARGAYAVLTGAGRERLREAEPLHREMVERRFLSHFSDEERLALAGYWERVLDASRT